MTSELLDKENHSLSLNRAATVYGAVAIDY